MSQITSCFEIQLIHFPQIKVQLGATPIDNDAIIDDDRRMSSIFNEFFRE